MNNKLINQFLHFDSISSQYIYDLNNTSGNCSNAFKTNFSMTTSFRKIKKVSLKSVEMVISFSNIRIGSTNTFMFMLNGTQYLVTLAEQNYTTINSFLAVMTSSCNSILSGYTITFTGSISSFSVIDTNLSKYILGFRTTDTFISNVYLATTANYNLNPDHYLNIYMPSLNSFNANQNGSWSTFKLPLDTINNQIYYYQDESSFEQFVQINDDNLVLSSLQVHILDRFGKNINSYGADYSFTLLISYEL